MDSSTNVSDAFALIGVLYICSLDHRLAVKHGVNPNKEVTLTASEKDIGVACHL